MTAPRTKARAESFRQLDGHQRGARRLQQFFQDNPSEELALSDIAAKFDVKPRTAEVYISALVSAGVLERVIVWRYKRETP